ncbi:MAG: zinc ribbon domain-containing protein [Candidatus Caldatribacteriota bacterium]|nr:zinc ribbon domain-containing protein [Atribacterota bacterium]MDD3641317.1 zinc ribbon domain-containing protein [Atribacterota bacterium]MDD4764976.1 zinc ribbon domain-containing protein [Atribacterota bacterium]
MPNYNYKCQDCQNVFEVTTSIKDMEEGIFPCPKCNSKKTKRLFDGFGFCGGSGNNNNISQNSYTAPT